MSMLMQLLIGREIAKRRGVEDSAEQTRIGTLAAILPSPALGLVVATMASDRAAPVRVVKPDDGGKPGNGGNPPDAAKPPEAAAPPSPAAKGRA